MQHQDNRAGDVYSVREYHARTTARFRSRFYANSCRCSGMGGSRDHFHIRQRHGQGQAKQHVIGVTGRERRNLQRCKRSSDRASRYEPSCLGRRVRT